MSLSDDPWIAETSDPVDPERLHALGVITLFWNHCERNLWFIFCVIFELHPRIGWILAHDIGNVAICERIRERVKLLKGPGVEVDDLILNALDIYEACRINRNTLTHFTISADDAGAISFVRTKGPIPIRHPLPSSLEDIRRIAHETKTLSVYLWHLYKGLESASADKPTPLPPKLAVPELLWKPLPQNGQEPQHLRLPSTLRLTEEEWRAKYSKEGRPLPDGAGGLKPGSPSPCVAAS
jgi:hypothetical protein